MRICFLLLFLLSRSSVGISQKSYAPLGARWAYDGHELDDNYEYRLFHVESELDIEEKDCSVIYSYSSTPASAEFTYTGDSLIVWEYFGRVYFLYESDFYLLYDFTIDEGDTVTTYSPPNLGFFTSQIFPDSIHNGPLEYTMQVINVEQISVEGVNLRVFDIELIDNLKACGYSDRIIENIGSTSEGFTGEWNCHVADGIRGGLVCYENDQFLFDQNNVGLNCDFTPSSGLSYLDERNQVLVYPNPAQDQLSIRYRGDAKVSSVQAYNVQSRLVGQWNGEELFLGSLPSGIYFLQISLVSGEKVVERIIKQ